MSKSEKYNKQIITGWLLLHQLFQEASSKNEDGMPVIKYINKPNGGSIAYIRYDAMVNKLNVLNNTKPEAE